MLIGIDMDSVLNDLDVAWTAWIREKYDLTFTRDKMTTWITDDDFPQIPCKVTDFFHIPGIFGTFNPQPGSIAVTKQLTQDGHQLFVVTSAHYLWWADKGLWLRKHFPHIPSHNYITTYQKHLLNLDVLVDDGLHNLVAFRGHKIIFDAPWNRRVPDELKGNTRRALDWSDVQRIIAHITACQQMAEAIPSGSSGTFCKA